MKNNSANKELPPRARRIPSGIPDQAQQIGTTSAHAENTLIASLISRKIWNYLRARGEYAMARSLLTTGAELPPRTRRIPRLGLLTCVNRGTTSAHAENTGGETTRPSGVWNYLRARGEYRGPKEYRPHHQELPPRTRRIPRLGLLTCVNRGTTSAHAENTGGETTRPSGVWNYLRARGEYARGQPHAGARTELPPRTRRIRRDHARLPREQGTTSAHAENTPTLTCPARWKRNYLRARGEYWIAINGSISIAELPPRTRRIQNGISSTNRASGTTSAHAENTSMARRQR